MTVEVQKELVLSVFIRTRPENDPNYRALIPTSAIVTVIDRGDAQPCEVVLANGEVVPMQHDWATIAEALGGYVEPPAGGLDPASGMAGPCTIIVQPATLGLRLKPFEAPPSLYPLGSVAMARQNGDDSSGTLVGWTEVIPRYGPVVVVDNRWIDIYDAYATVNLVKDIAKNPHLP